MAIDKLNLFTQASAMQAISPTKAAIGQSSAEVSGNPASKNPFAKENKGVGLVNSDLAGMSYKLPNGKQSTCNTIGIG